MTWARLHEQIAASEKLPRLSDVAFRVWAYVLAKKDSAGRYYADPKLVSRQAMPQYDYRLEQIGAALVELERERLIHLYDCGRSRYLVFHDNSDWNPVDAVASKAKPLYPPPPTGLCPCLAEGEKSESGRGPDRHLSTLSSLSGSSPASEGRESEGRKPLDAHTLPTGPPLNRSSREGRLAAAWLSFNKGAGVTERKAQEEFAFALDRGANYQALEKLVGSRETCAGRYPGEIAKGAMNGKPAAAVPKCPKCGAYGKAGVIDLGEHLPNDQRYARCTEKIHA